MINDAVQLFLIMFFLLYLSKIYLMRWSMHFAIIMSVNAFFIWQPRHI